MTDDPFNIRQQMLRRLSDALNVPLDGENTEKSESTESEEETEE